VTVQVPPIPWRGCERASIAVAERPTAAPPSAWCVWRSPRSWCDRSDTTHPLEGLCAPLNRGGRAPRPIPPHQTALLEARVARAPRTACVCGPGGPKEARPALAGQYHTLRLRSGRCVGAAHTEKTDSGGRDASLWPLPSVTVPGARNRIQHDCLVACVSRDYLARLEVPLSAGVVHSKTFPFVKISE